MDEISLIDRTQPIPGLLERSKGQNQQQGPSKRYVCTSGGLKRVSGANVDLGGACGTLGSLVELEMRL